MLLLGSFLRIGRHARGERIEERLHALGLLAHVVGGLGARGHGTRERSFESPALLEAALEIRSAALQPVAQPERRETVILVVSLDGTEEVARPFGRLAAELEPRLEVGERGGSGDNGPVGPVSAGGVESFATADYSAYYRSVKRRYLDVIDTEPATYPEPCEHCSICDWSTVCDRRLREDDHLSLVAGITRKQRKALTERGVHTLEALAALATPLEPRLESVSPPALHTIREQARLQAEGRRERRPKHEILAHDELRMGLLALPEPNEGDLFFDLEGDPFAFSEAHGGAVREGLEYLFGWVDADGGYEALWALSPEEERARFETFIDRVIERLERWPGLHIYHYAAYEPGALKRLAARYATREDEVDRLLRGEVLVDLYRVVRQGVRASVESYSIKKMEPFYGFERAVDLRAPARVREVHQSRKPVLHPPEHLRVRGDLQHRSRLRRARELGVHHLVRPHPVRRRALDADEEVRPPEPPAVEERSLIDDVRARAHQLERLVGRSRELPDDVTVPVRLRRLGHAEPFGAVASQDRLLVLVSTAAKHLAARILEVRLTDLAPHPRALERREVPAREEPAQVFAERMKSGPTSCIRPGEAGGCGEYGLGEAPRAMADIDIEATRRAILFGLRSPEVPGCPNPIHWTALMGLEKRVAAPRFPHISPVRAKALPAPPSHWLGGFSSPCASPS